MKMKTVNYPRNRRISDKFNVKSADWQDIEEVFKGFDKQLADHGLEVVMYDTCGDTYVWRIAKKR
jgi:hypothetical protein